MTMAKEKSTAAAVFCGIYIALAYATLAFFLAPLLAPVVFAGGIIGTAIVIAAIVYLLATTFEFIHKIIKKYAPTDKPTSQSKISIFTEYPSVDEKQDDNIYTHQPSNHYRTIDNQIVYS